MITEERLAQIIEEENIRRELREKDKKKSKIWDFLNSNFGIWLLSSVALGLITWGYSEINQSIAIRKKNAIEIRKHDMEIASRVKSYLTQVNHLRQNTDYFKANNTLLSTGVYAFPEFQNLSLGTILSEQSTLVSDDRREEIEIALKGLDDFTNSSITQLVGNSREEWQAPINDSLKKNAIILKNIVLKSFENKHWK